MISIQPLYPTEAFLFLSALLTQRHADAVALGVQQASNLREVAVEASVVLVHGAFQKKGVLGV